MYPYLAFARFDKNKDGHLDDKEFKKYFDQDYMKEYESIAIDPKFIDGTIKFLKMQDKDENGLTVEELMEGVMPKEKPIGSN